MCPNFVQMPHVTLHRAFCHGTVMVMHGFSYGCECMALQYWPELATQRLQPIVYGSYMLVGSEIMSSRDSPPAEPVEW